MGLKGGISIDADSGPLSRAVVSGGAKGAPKFGSSVNPIPTRGGRLYPPDY